MQWFAVFFGVYGVASLLAAPKKDTTEKKAKPQ